jgi:hypothetical protein
VPANFGEEYFLDDRLLEGLCTEALGSRM